MKLSNINENDLPINELIIHIAIEKAIANPSKKCHFVTRDTPDTIFKHLQKYSDWKHNIWIRHANLPQSNTLGIDYILFVE